MQDSVAAVILAAGSSQRMGGLDKLWLPLSGRVVLARTIDVFEVSSLIQRIVLVVNARRLADATTLCQQAGWQKVVAIVVGGENRQASARIGLDALAKLESDTHWVMLHDGARPFVTSTLIEQGLQTAKEHLAAIPVVPIKDTIKQVDQGQVHSTLDRTQIWAVQTPQVFSFPLLYQAYHSPAAQEEVFTDDAALLERQGQRIATFPGSYANSKITTPEDLLFAEALLGKKRDATSIKFGIGYDVHAFTPDRPLILAGVTIPFDYGLAGHSDADVVIHAIVDALLGASALGDIGVHFPPDDMRWKDMSSTIALDYTYTLLHQNGWELGNVDVTIVAQRPVLASFIPAMRKKLAEHLGQQVEQISVKATTTDGLGFAGRKEGIACYAVASIHK